MSHSPSDSPRTPTIGSAPPPPPVVLPGGLDLRTASASQLIIEVMHVEDLLSAVDVHDPTIVELIWREQSIRAELSRRETLLMHGLRWATVATNPES